MRLGDLLDISVLQRLADANYKASGMPIGIIDAVDGSVLIGSGWQDICMMYHRANPVSAERCRESDEYIKLHLSEATPCAYTCRNGLRDIGLPIRVAGEHLATLFLGQFFYEGESPDREFFVRQARQLGFDEAPYLAALDRVPVFGRVAVENILAYNAALARVISDLAEGSLRRRQAEADAESLARFPKENPDPILRLASDLTVLYANDAARSTLKDLGIAPGMPAPAVIADVVRRARSHSERVRAELASGDRFFSMTVVVVGTEVNVYAHDITARVRAEEALREADRRKDEFLGMLSHELRNPLAPIRNSLYILDRAEPAGQQARRAKAVANRQVAHLTRLVDDLLDVTRIVRGKIELRRTDVDVANLARRTGEDHSALMHERGLAFQVEAPQRPVWIDGDETRLAQVIGNLLQNAAKFTPPGGCVTLSVVSEADAVELHVRDTGSGIEPGLLKDIFEPFVQGEQSLARTEGGLGLGLALVKAVAELHGGTVAVSSEGRGRGAEFTVRLPLAVDLRVAREPAPREMLAGSTRRRVLVVDDRPDAAESLAELVRVLGHVAEVAFDGPTAIEKAVSHPPDVVLCDIGMPGMSGYDVAKVLRSDPRFDGVHLVAVSGYALPEHVRLAAEAGFTDYIAKPPDPARLEQVLARPAATSRDGWTNISPA